MSKLVHYCCCESWIRCCWGLCS